MNPDVTGFGERHCRAKTEEDRLLKSQCLYGVYR